MLENITLEIGLGLLAFVVGLVFVFGSAYRKQVGWKFNPMWSGVIGVGLIVLGGAFGVIPSLPAFGEGTVVNVSTPGVTVEQPTFHVDVANGTCVESNVTTVQVNEAESLATILLETCGSGGTQPLAGTHFGINFTVAPIPPVGATADSLATVYFETPYLMKYDGEYILDEASSTYYANWSYAGGTSDEATADYDGSMTMLMTETGYCEITYELDSGSANTFSNEITTIGDSGSWDISLHNADWSWSFVLPVTWILVEQ